MTDAERQAFVVYQQFYLLRCLYIIRYYQFVKAYGQRDSLEKEAGTDAGLLGEIAPTEKDPTGHWASGKVGSVKVHQQAIDRVGAADFEPTQLNVLKDQQVEVDKEQRNEMQHMHAMTGKGVVKPAAIRSANIFVYKELESAKLCKAGADNLDRQIQTRLQKGEKFEGQLREMAKTQDYLRNLSLKHLGSAIHTLQDSTSPEHAGFKSWDNDGPFDEQAKHGLSENYYPRAGSRERAQLEGSTKYAIDVYMGRDKNRKEVFNEDGFITTLPQISAARR